MVVNPLASLVYDVPVLGPTGVGFATMGAVWQQVLAFDATRRGVIFHNPGAIDLLVAPANLPSQPVNGAGAIRIYPQSEAVILAENEHDNVNSAWMGWSDGGANQPISILNFTGTNNSAPAPQPLASLRQGSSINSPSGSGVSVGTASVPLIGANAVRRGITFHNPGSVVLGFAPANLSASIGAGSIILLPGQSKTFMAKPQSRIRVNCGWNGIAQSDSNNPVTILEHLG